MARRAEREQNGVPLSETLLKQVDEVAKSLAITPVTERIVMTEAEAKPSPQGSPFWRFSLRFYRQPGVADACIALQEESGVDVNLLMFLLWQARAARSFSAAEVAGLESRIGGWRDIDVVPLRARAARAEVAAAAGAGRHGGSLPHQGQGGRARGRAAAAGGDV